VAGVSSCKVRALSSGERKVVKKAGPSEPVELSGWNGIPMVGDLVLEVENDQRAREVVDFRSNIEDASKMQGAKKTIRSSKRDARTSRIMENQKTKAVLEARRVRRREARHALREALVREANETLSINEREVNILLKTDVVGSEEALLPILEDMSNEYVAVNIVRSGVGELTQNDVELAQSLDACVMVFNLPRNRKMDSVCDQQDVDVFYHKIIYEMMDQVEGKVLKLMPSQEVVVGEAEVLQVFALSGGKKGFVAGSRVDTGVVTTNAMARVKRNGEIVYEGKVAALKRLKDDVDNVQAGTECGIMLDDCEDVRANDVIEIYELQQVTKKDLA